MQVQRNLDLQEKAVYVSATKHRLVMCIAKQVREIMFHKLTPEEQIDCRVLLWAKKLNCRPA